MIFREPSNRPRICKAQFIQNALATQWVAVVTLGIIGCTAPFTDLERDAQRMIERRQALTLGEDGPREGTNPSTTVSPEPTDATFDSKPGTYNPAVDKLPAENAPARQTPDGQPEIPQLLDPADDAREMTLEEVLAYAIENSREYRNRKEELYLAALSLLAERHLWGPRFFNDFTAAFSGTPEAGDHDQVSELVNEFRVTQRLPYGGEVSVSALVNLVNTLKDASDRSPDSFQTSELRLDATLPLLRGAGQTAREDLIQAERNLIYATRSFERFRREFFVEIAVSYFGLLARQDRLENQRLQVKGLERLAARFQALAEAGRVPFFEAERSEAEVLFAVNNLTNDEEDYASALDSFKIRIGMPTTTGLTIQPSDIVVPEPALDRIKSVMAGKLNRLDLQTIEDQVEDARRGVNIAKNALLPDLDLFADVRLPTDSRDREGIGNFALGDGSYEAGVRFGAPLDRRIEWIGYRRSLITLERAHRSFTLAADEVAQDVRSSLRRIKQARFTLALQERNVQLSERRLKGVLLQEDELEPRDVIEAEEDLLEARNRRDAAIRDLRVSILQYLLDTGQMRVDPAGRWQPPGRLRVLGDEKDPAEPGVRDEAGDDADADDENADDPEA